MSLALFEKQFDDVDLELRCLGEWDAIWRRRARCRLPNAEGGSLPYRHNLGDGCFTIEHVDGLATAHGAKVFAQPGFQLSDTYLPHGLL